MIIGITGSFGSGKTAVANMFRKYGFKVIDVDRLYHDDFYKNHPLRNRIKKEFGTLNRKELKKIVFSDYSKLRRLNRITHPVIIKAIKTKIRKILTNSNKKTSITKKINDKHKSFNGINKKMKTDNPNVKIIVDIPLLFEAKVEKLFDRVLVVECDEKAQISRLLKKKRYTRKEIQQIIKSQMPLKKKKKKADFVIKNSSSLNKTELQVRKAIKSLKWQT